MEREFVREFFETKERIWKRRWKIGQDNRTQKDGIRRKDDRRICTEV